MNGGTARKRVASCACGHVAFETVGDPIVCAACHCTSCRTAGRVLASLHGTGPVVDAAGGTDFVLQRKDRVRLVRGGEALAEYRLTPSSKTRRVVATCCNSPMFLEFSGGHWLSMYMARFPATGRPPLEMRVMTGDLEAGVAPADALPRYRSHSPRFMWRLLKAWAAMGFRVPKIDYVRGVIHGS